MTNILLSFRHTKYSKIKVTVRPEQKRHLICPEIAWSVRIEHIVWFTWTDHAFTPNRWSVLFEAIACFPPPPLHPQTSMNKRLWRGHANLYFAITLHSSYIRPKREPVCNKYTKNSWDSGRFWWNKVSGWRLKELGVEWLYSSFFQKSGILRSCEVILLPIRCLF